MNADSHTYRDTRQNSLILIFSNGFLLAYYIEKICRANTIVN